MARSTVAASAAAPKTAVSINERDLRRMFPNARADYVRVLVENADVLDAHGIMATVDRWCAFIANVGTETGGLTIVRENMAYTAKNLLAVFPSRYPNTVAGRARAASHAKKGARYVANYNYGFRLGNKGRNTNDGYDFRGALLLQATGRDMAEWLQRETGVPYADNPELFNIIDRNAVIIAAKTWASQQIGDLNLWADKGSFRACCNGINRGNPKSSLNPIGWPDRQAWYAKAKKVWGDAEPDEPGLLVEGSRGWEVETYQKRLGELGYQVGKIDGIFGDQMDMAVRNFQKVNGLEVDGKVGPLTRLALVSDDALPKPISEERANTTAKELADAGDATVANARKGRTLGFMLGGMGATGGVIDTVSQINNATDQIRNVAEPASHNIEWLIRWWPLGVVAAGFIVWQLFGDVISKEVESYRSGKKVA